MLRIGAEAKLIVLLKQSQHIQISIEFFWLYQKI